MTILYVDDILGNYMAEFNQIRHGTSIIVVADLHYAKSRIDHVAPPSGRTFTLVVSYNSRYDCNVWTIVSLKLFGRTQSYQIWH